MDSPLEVLIRARKLIEDPKHWMKGYFSWKRGDEYAYCGSGALLRAGVKNLENHPAYIGLMSSISKEYRAFSAFNDTHTHAEVLEAFDSAIDGFSN